MVLFKRNQNVISCMGLLSSKGYSDFVQTNLNIKLIIKFLAIWSCPKYHLYEENFSAS